MSSMHTAIVIMATLALTSTAAAQQSQPVAAEEEASATADQAPITITTTLTPPPQLACQAQFELSWYQMGANVKVEAELNNADCAASSGTYIIQVRYRGDAPEIFSKEFPETWERADDQAVLIEKEYEIADDVDVLRVRPRKLRCECREPAPADEPPATD